MTNSPSVSAKAIAALLGAAIMGVGLIIGTASFTFDKEPELTLKERIEGILVEDSHTAQDNWIFLVTSGPMKNMSGDAEWAASLSKAELAAATQGGGGIYQRQRCNFYSSSGNPQSFVDAETAVYCTRERVTRAQVLDYFKKLRTPEPEA